MDVERVAQYWLTTANDDLTASEHLFASGDYTHALFLGHLNLEKLLKAGVVLHTGEHAPLSHNLRYLAEKSGIILAEGQESVLVRVTEYSIKTRYPDMALQFKHQCTREFCKTELRQIKEFGKWIEEMMRS